MGPITYNGPVGNNRDDIREKNWKHVYTRSDKVHRASQLGFPYPRQTGSRVLEGEILNLLFICSMNRWRSPTAEAVYSKEALLETRSAGISSNAKHPIQAKDLKWADVVFVMEPKHLQRLQADFPGEMKYKECHVLEIPDDFKFMDPELVEAIHASVDPLLGR